MPPVSLTYFSTARRAKLCPFAMNAPVPVRLSTTLISYGLFAPSCALAPIEAVTMMASAAAQIRILLIILAHDHFVAAHHTARNRQIDPSCHLLGGKTFRAGSPYSVTTASRA